MAAIKKSAVKTGKSRVLRPKPLKPKKGFDLLTILGKTRGAIIENAKRDKVKIVAVRVSKAGNKLFSKSLTYDRTKGKIQIRPHKHWIEQDEGGKFTKASKLKLSCDCEHWMFTYEYAMTHHNASWIKFSNGEFPILKNPRLQPGLCKHLWTLLVYVKRNRL